MLNWNTIMRRGLVCGAAVAMASFASAQDKKGDKPADKPTEKHAEQKDATKPADLAKAIGDAKLDIKKVIANAEAADKGRAVAVWFKMADKQVEAIVHTAVGDKCMSVIVDHTGKAGEGKPADKQDEKHAHVGAAADIAKAMDSAKLTLASAIDAAAAHSKGTPICAVSELTKGELHVDVFCVVGEKVMECMVDKSGKVGEMKEVDWSKHESQVHKHGDHKDHKHEEKKDGKGGDTKKP